MGTFLTTSKMSPELAARVEASVVGKSASSVRARRLVKAVVRVVVVAAVAITVTVVVKTKRRVDSEREAARSALLDAVRPEVSSVTDADRKIVAQSDALLIQLCARDGTDRIADDLRSTDRLKALLARPAVYVRGPIASFTTSAAIDDVVYDSTKDALLGCLYDPPASRTEKVVLARARASFEDATSNVQRLADAHFGLPYMSPKFVDQINDARDVTEIEKLSGRFKKVPVARARQALKAEVLIVAMDDTASGTGPTELDGARAHDIVFAIADIRAQSVLVRLKKHVDPSWVSLEARPQHASKLDSCKLAMDLRDAVTKR
jgi:hypothetical protein